MSGQCGRLKCCLNYELDTYLDALQQFPENADTLQVAKGTALLIKKDIFKNLMWYVLPDSNKQYPLLIDRVKQIKKLNQQNVVPDDLGAVEATGKPKEELVNVDLTGQFSLKTLDKADRKKREMRRGPNPPRRDNRPGTPPQKENRQQPPRDNRQAPQQRDNRQQPPSQPRENRPPPPIKKP